MFRGGRFELVSLGFLLALWSGSRALNVFVDTIAIMYGQSGVRGIVRTRALSFSLYLTALVFGVVIIPLVLLGPTLIDGWLPDRVRFLGSLYWPVVVVATMAALTTLFHVATPQKTRWWRESPGAVLALVIWVLASFVVRGAVGLSLDGTSIYGPLSAPIVVLIWLYALAIAVLIGAGLNAATRVLWPVEVRVSPTTRLVEWARSEMERRRSYGEGEGDVLLDDLMATEQQYLDLAWPSAASGAGGPEGLLNRARCRAYPGFGNRLAVPLLSTCTERGSYTAGVRADVAQLVERNLAKVEVAGSSPVVRSEASRLTCLRGGVAERRGSGLQSRVHGFKSRLHLDPPEHTVGLPRPGSGDWRSGSALP